MQHTRHEEDRDTKRLHAVGLAALLLLFLVVIWPLRDGRIYVSDDLGHLHLPLRYFYADCLRQGYDFSWSPHLFCGYYLLGEGQCGMWHPLHLLLYRWLPLTLAFNAEFLLNYVAMCAGASLLLRRYLPRDAALLGGIVFTLGSFCSLHYPHINAIAVFAHLPWAMLCIDIVLRSDCAKRRAAALGGLILLTASQLLLGHPQAVWFSGFAEGLYVMFLRPLWWHRWRLPLLLMWAKALGILCGSAQMLPTLDLAAAAGRLKMPSWYYLTGSLHPANLLQAVAPYLFDNRVIGTITHEYAGYWGAAAVPLLLWLAARRRHLGPLQRPAAAAATLAAIAWLLAMGRFGGLYRLQLLLPIIGQFRYPARYLALVQLAVAVLCALAFADLRWAGTQHRTAPRGLATRLIWLAPLLSLAAAAPALIWPHARPACFDGNPFAAHNAVLAGPGLVLAATLLVHRAALGRKHALAGLLLLTVVDLGVYGVSYLWRTPAATVEAFAASIDRPPPGPHRTQYASNVLSMAGNRDAFGYAGIVPRPTLDVMALPYLRLKGVRWVHILPGMSPELDVERARGKRWLSVDDPLPRARLVTQVRVSEHPRDDIPKLDINRVALTEIQLDLPGGTPGDAEIVAEEPGRIVLDTQGDTRQLLVLAETWHPGWQLTIDGAPTTILRVYGDFMGAVVEPGHHQLHFSFRPRSRRLGLVLSLIGLLLSALTIALDVWHSRAT